MAQEFDVVRANLLPVAGTVTDNDMILIVQGGRPKRALPSVMKGKQGDPGLSAFLGVNTNYILWKQGASGTWQNLLEIERLRGPKGEKPIFRKVGGTLQMKYEGEPDTAWLNIFDRDELKMKFSDLTAEERDLLTLHFSDLTAAEKAELMKPATDAAKIITEKMAQIEKDANQVIERAEEAAGKAETAAGKVKDGKTPVLGMVNAQSGDNPSGSFVSDGVDESGNPKYRLNLTLPAGKDGQPAIFEQGISTTLEPNEEARVEVLDNGETEQGNPKYTLNFFIPRGQVGNPGEGNVSVDATGLVIGKKYLFVPDSDGSASGSFVEYVAPVIPEQIPADWGQTDPNAKDFIKNKPTIPEEYDDTAIRKEIADNLQAAKTYTNDQISGIVQFDIVVVDSLPASGVKGTIYLIPKAGSNNDVHDEYIWIESTRGYELIGTTSVDLSDYYTRTQANDTFVKKSGDTMTGLLTVSNNFIDIKHDSTKGVRFIKVDNTEIGSVGTIGADVNLYNKTRGKYLSYNANGTLTFEDYLVYHDGNIAKAYPSYRVWVENGPDKYKKISVLGDDNTYYPHKIDLLSTSIRSQLPVKLFLQKKLNTPSGNWPGNHANGTSSCIGIWEFRAGGWDGNGNYGNTITLKEEYAKVVGNILYGTTDWTGIIIWLRGGSTDSGAEYELRTDDAFLSVAVADLTKFPPFTTDKLHEHNRGVVFGNQTNMDFNIGRLRSQGNVLTYGASASVIWNEGNDGAGSGLDADKLDGHESTDFISYRPRIIASQYPDRVYGYGYDTEGWPNTGPAMSFGASPYVKQIIGPYNDNSLRLRTVINNVPTDWRNFAFEDQIPTASSLLSAEQKAKLDRMRSQTTAASVSNLNVDYENILVTLTTNGTLSVNRIGTAYDGLETSVFIKASGQRTVVLPTTGNYISMCGSSITILNGKWCELSLKCVGGIWRIAKLEQE